MVVVAEERGATGREGEGERRGALTPAERFREFWIPSVPRLSRRVSRKLVSAREISSFISRDRLSRAFRSRAWYRPLRNDARRSNSLFRWKDFARVYDVNVASILKVVILYLQVYKSWSSHSSLSLYYAMRIYVFTVYETKNLGARYVWMVLYLWYIILNIIIAIDAVHGII